MSQHIIPHVVKPIDVYTVSPSATVQDAVTMMTEYKIGAIIVRNQGEEGLQGIFSERDLLTRVIAASKDPKTTKLADVMTRDVVTVKGDDSANDALQRMHELGCRHLPVVEDDKVISMVSVRDLYGALHKSLQEDLKEQQAFIYGGGY